MNGSGNWTRTSDPRINSPLLYQLSYAGKNGLLDRIRTCDLRIRNPMLYPAELRGATVVLMSGFYLNFKEQWLGRKDSNLDGRVQSTVTCR